jgi:hypothetical protein
MSEIGLAGANDGFFDRVANLETGLNPLHPF